MKKIKNLDSNYFLKVILGIIVFGIFYLLSKIAPILILKYEKKAKIYNNSKKLLLDFLSKTISYVILLVGVFYGLSIIGFDLGFIMVIIGTLGFGIAFALKDFLSGCINGVIIIIRDYYKPGDLIMVGESMGFVKNFDLLNTEIEDIDGILHYMPNTAIVNAPFQNYSKGGNLKVTANACISNADNTKDIVSLLKEFEGELRKMDYRINDSVFAIIISMDENGTVVQAGITIKAENFYAARKALRMKLRMFLREKGVLLCDRGSRYIGSS